MLQHPRTQGWLTVITAVDPQSQPVLATIAVVLSILLQLIRRQAEPELLFEPTADGLEYGPLGIGPLDTQPGRIDEHLPVGLWSDRAPEIEIATPTVSLGVSIGTSSLAHDSCSRLREPSRTTVPEMLVQHGGDDGDDVLPEGRNQPGATRPRGMTEDHRLWQKTAGFLGVAPGKTYGAMYGTKAWPCAPLGQETQGFKRRNSCNCRCDYICDSATGGGSHASAAQFAGADGLLAARCSRS